MAKGSSEGLRINGESFSRILTGVTLACILYVGSQLSVLTTSSAVLETKIDAIKTANELARKQQEKMDKNQSNSIEDIRKYLITKGFND